MNKLSKKILIGTLLAITTLNVSANEFFYKSKQENENLVRYNQVITANSLIKNIKINKNENKKSIIFKELQNKNNTNHKYNGKIEVTNVSGEFKKNILINLNDTLNTKDLFLKIETNNEVSIMEKIFSKNKGDLLNYLNTSKFELLLNNNNDTSFIFSMLDLNNKKDLFEKLTKLNSNNVKESLIIKKELIEDSKIRYNLNIENILNLSIQGSFKIKNANLFFENINIEINVIEELEQLKDFESIFNIELKKGLNKKEIKEIKIKL